MKECFKNKAYIAYLTIGDGGIEYSVECALAYVEGGVDIVEMGIPFTDPIADGPVIQKAMQRALSEKITPLSALTFVEKFRRHSKAPLLLFSYYNPLLQMGDGYIEELASRGVDGAIVVDLPFDEAMTLSPLIETIPLLTPSSKEGRVDLLAEKKPSFVYYVCQKGSTGEKSAIPQETFETLASLKRRIDAPIAAGFGISSREMAKELLEVADGFVVGSYLVKAMEEKIAPEEMTRRVRSLDPR